MRYDPDFYDHWRIYDEFGDTIIVQDAEGNPLPDGWFSINVRTGVGQKNTDYECVTDRGRPHIEFFTVPAPVLLKRADGKDPDVFDVERCRREGIYDLARFVDADGNDLPTDVFSINVRTGIGERWTGRRDPENPDQLETETITVPAPVTVLIEEKEEPLQKPVGFLDRVMSVFGRWN